MRSTYEREKHWNVYLPEALGFDPFNKAILSQEFGLSEQLDDSIRGGFLRSYLSLSRKIRQGVKVYSLG